MRRRWHILLTAVALAGAVGCSVRQIPLRPVLDPVMDEKTPKARGEVVALIMDPRVSDFVRERDFSLTQEERYASGAHFMRSLLVQLRARGLTVLEVESEEQGADLGASWVLIPDTPGVNVIRPKGVLDFSFLGSLNRISVSYGVRALKAGARIPERVSGSSSRTASFFWSNALLQSVGLSVLGLVVSGGIYAAYFGFVVSQNVRAGSKNPRDYLYMPPAAAVTVLVADIIVSQITAQVIPRFINPMVDLFVNEPRWEVMVQDAHDDALTDLADNVVKKVIGAPARKGGEP